MFFIFNSGYCGIALHMWDFKMASMLTQWCCATNFQTFNCEYIIKQTLNSCLSLYERRIYHSQQQHGASINTKYSWREKSFICAKPSPTQISSIGMSVAKMVVKYGFWVKIGQLKMSLDCKVLCIPYYHPHTCTQRQDNGNRCL